MRSRAANSRVRHAAAGLAQPRAARKRDEAKLATYDKVNPAQNKVLTLALTSDSIPPRLVDEYATQFLIRPLSQLTGIGLVDMNGDGDLLFEAVANLLDNAIKFTPSGGRVEVSLRPRPEGPSIMVTDTGPGIPSADFRKMLRRSHRGDRSRRTPGAGLGLSLVASIVRLHGFHLALRQGSPGCSIELECWPHAGDLSISGGVFSADTP